MMALPMTVGAVTLSIPLLTMLQQTYTVAFPILIVTSLSTFINSLWTILNIIITGADQIDQDINVSFRNFFNSCLFLPVKLSYTRIIFYLPITYCGLQGYKF